VLQALPAMYKGMPRVPDLDVDLRGAQAAWVGSGTYCLISCACGTQLAVRVRTEGPLHQRIQVRVRRGGC
jgi:hypothetical protein